MNIYVFGSPYTTARLLSKEERMKQLYTAQRVMSAINNGDFSDPRVAQYKGHMQWIKYYRLCLISYRDTNPTGQKLAFIYSKKADKIRPVFHDLDYFVYCGNLFAQKMDIDKYYDHDKQMFCPIPDKTAPKSRKNSLLSRFVEKVKKFIDKMAERL